MNVHELTLQNYTAASGCPSACQPMLYLGTAGSYGNEQINVVLGEGWQGLTVKAVFQPSDVPVVVPAGGGVISVPWEATQSVVAYPHGRISFQGYVSGRLVNTSDVPYTVGGSSAGTDNTPAPTPDEFQQFVDAVKSDADRAAQAAADAEAAVQKVTDAGTQAVTDIGNAKDSALEAIDKAREEAASSISADVEGAKQAAADAEKSAADAEQSAKDAAAALEKVQAAGQSALDDIATERQNTLSDIQNEGAKQQSAVAGAGTAALEAIGQTEQAAINQIQQAGATQAAAVQSAGTTQIGQVNSAGTAQVQAVKDEGAAQTAALNDAAEAHKNDLESIASHPPQPNTATGKWQVWNAETGAYQDTDALYQGGYYTPAVSDDGVITWQGSQPGMPAIPGANIKGPKGDKGDPGLGVPSPTQSDAGKVPTVKADGSAYELAGPYAPLSAAIRPTVSGNPAVCEDSIAWAFQGLRIYGKSTQDGTPSPENPVPIVSAGERGGVEIAVTGKNLLNMSRCSAFAKSYGLTPVIDGDSVLISGTATATMSIAVFTILTTNDEFLVGRNFKFSWFTDQAITSISGLGTNNKINLTMSLQEGQSYNFAIKISVWLEKLDAWEPYTGQSLTISTPNGLPGIPVDSGGNYTDASGQQWICDEIDYARKVYVQRVFSVMGKSVEIYVDSSTRRQASFSLQYQGKNTVGYSNHFQYGDIQLPGYFSVNHSNLTLYARFELETSLEQINQILLDSIFIYVLATPIETPLSEEEIAAYRALHTYDGTTVVSTAEDVAGLEVKYLADGEKYVERIVSQKAPEAAAAHTMALLADAIRGGVNGV